MDLSHWRKFWFPANHCSSMVFRERRNFSSLRSILDSRPVIFRGCQLQKLIPVVEDLLWREGKSFCPLLHSTQSCHIQNTTNALLLLVICSEPFWQETSQSGSDISTQIENLTCVYKNGLTPLNGLSRTTTTSDTTAIFQ